MSYKTEVIDALEVYKRNTAHVLGEDSDMTRAIDRCIALTNEVKVWTPVEEGLPELVNTIDEMRYSDSVLCVDKEGVYVSANCGMTDISAMSTAIRRMSLSGWSYQRRTGNE